MTLTFLGTRGNTKIRSKLHQRHSSLLVRHDRGSVMIDCGADWHDDLWCIDPAAIVLTHAHPDHAFGLSDGAPCPVYATEWTWNGIGAYDLRDPRLVVPRKPVEIEGIRFEVFPVEHSTRAPAVGYRISADSASFFYVPDVVFIPDRTCALSGISLYIGDGATMTRSMVRKRGDRLIGHTSVRTQLTWCQKERVPRAVFTHCGSEIIRSDQDVLSKQVQGIGNERGVQAEIAHDGLTISVC